MQLICMALLFFSPDVCQYQPYDDLPLMVTAYNPMQGGINCDSDCNVFGTGIEVTPEHFGTAAACPTEWVKLDRTAVITIHGNDYRCVDNFGSVENRYPVYRNGDWYLRVDLVLEEPDLWGVQIIDGWSMRWE